MITCTFEYCYSDYVFAAMLIYACLIVYLSFSRITQKVLENYGEQYGKKIGIGPRINQFDFGDDLDLETIVIISFSFLSISGQDGEGLLYNLELLLYYKKLLLRIRTLNCMDNTIQHILRLPERLFAWKMYHDPKSMSMKSYVRMDLAQICSACTNNYWFNAQSCT